MKLPLAPVARALGVALFLILAGAFMGAVFAFWFTTPSLLSGY